MSNQGPSVETKGAHILETATVSGTMLYGKEMLSNYLKENWLPEMAMPLFNMAVGKAMEKYNKPVVQEVLDLELKDNQPATGLGLIWQSAKEYELRGVTKGLGQAGVDFLTGRFLTIAGSQYVIPVVSGAIKESLSAVIPEEYQALAAIAANFAVAGAYFTGSEVAKSFIKKQATYPLLDKIFDKKLDKGQLIKIAVLAKRIDQLKDLQGKKDNMLRGGYNDKEAQNLNQEAQEALEAIRDLRAKLAKDKIPVPKEPTWENLPMKPKNKPITTSHENKKQEKKQPRKQPQPKKARKKSPRRNKRRSS